MKEKERKFLLNPNHLPTSVKEDPGVEIMQGYLLLGGPGQLRIRITDNKVAHLCYKHSNSTTDREEFEYRVPLEDALEMMALAPHVLLKHRVVLENGKICIDRYPSGKQVVEVEYDEEPEFFPPYCGEEVTGVKEYSNIWIAQNEGI